MTKLDARTFHGIGNADIDRVIELITDAKFDALKGVLAGIGRDQPTYAEIKARLSEVHLDIDGKDVDAYRHFFEFCRICHVDGNGVENFAYFVGVRLYAVGVIPQ